MSLLPRAENVDAARVSAVEASTKFDVTRTAQTDSHQGTATTEVGSADALVAAGVTVSVLACTAAPAKLAPARSSATALLGPHAISASKAVSARTVALLGHAQVMHTSCICVTGIPIVHVKDRISEGIGPTCWTAK